MEKEKGNKKKRTKKKMKKGTGNETKIQRKDK